MSEYSVQPVFVKRKHELADLLKQVEKGSKQAVELLVSTMNADEDKVSLKVRLECAKAIVDLQVKVADTISKDQFTRQLADIKVSGLKQTLELTEGQKRSAPSIDFDTVQEIKG